MLKPVKMVCREERFPAKITNMFSLSIPVLALHMGGEVSLVLKPGRADLTEKIDHELIDWLIACFSLTDWLNKIIIPHILYVNYGYELLLARCEFNYWLID